MLFRKTFDCIICFSFLFLFLSCSVLYWSCKILTLTSQTWIITSLALITYLLHMFWGALLTFLVMAYWMQGTLSSSFPIENRISQVTVRALKNHLDRTKNLPFVKRISDFHLLLFVARFLDLSDVPALAECVQTQTTVPEGYQLIIVSMANTSWIALMNIIPVLQPKCRTCNSAFPWGPGAFCIDLCCPPVGHRCPNNLNYTMSICTATLSI